MNCVHIEATTLPDAWFQAVYKLLEVGRDFTIDRGSFEGDKRLEYDWFSCRIKVPGYPYDRISNDQLTPKIPAHYNIPDPVEPGYIDQYLPYLMTGVIAPGESYTYGSRLCDHGFDIDMLTNCSDHADDILIKELDEIEKLGIVSYENGTSYIDQIQMVIWTYKNKGYRNNQMILQVGQPEDMILQDPACLRSIDTRIQDGKLHFFPYYRSWDMFSGFPANLAAIQVLKEYMASEIGVEDGEIIASSKGLHMYKYVWKLAECIRGKTIEEFRSGN